MLVGNKGSPQFALSRSSLQEVLDRDRCKYLQCALEMLEYWESSLATYEGSHSASSEQYVTLSAKLGENRFGYLSTKDAVLIRGEALLEGDVFLTMESKLARNAAHIEPELGIKVLQPGDSWDFLKSCAALLA